MSNLGSNPSSSPLLGAGTFGIGELTATVAVGGVTPKNAGEVLKAGAGAIAVCSAVTEAKDPTAACRALKEKIASFNKE